MMKIFSKNIFIYGLCLATSFFLYSCADQADMVEQISGERAAPNVIIINTDDVGYGDVGVYGATKIRTPNIDRLAEEGRMFTDFHSASAVCSPSRYALLTGEYPVRRDFWHPIFLRAPLQVDTTAFTIGHLMQEAGYATAVIGKWHLGFGLETPVDWNAELKPGPLELGFDYYFGIPVLNSHPPFVYVENHRVVNLDPDDPFVYGERAETEEFPEKYDLNAIGGAAAAHQTYRDREVGTVLKDKAIEWIQENKADPFFLYFATPHIHHPFTPDNRFVGTSEAGRYGDYMHELDWMVGEILNLLDEEGLTDNTLIIFTSDNGGMINQGGQDAIRAGHRLNGDLLGFKFDAWEGGHRVPFIARWPGKIPAGTQSDQLAANVDFLATLAALTGRELRENEGPDSYNLLRPLLKQTVSYRYHRGGALVSSGTGWVERIVVDRPEVSTFFTPLSICLNIDSFEHLEFETRPDQLIVYSLVQGDERVVLEFRDELKPAVLRPAVGDDAAPEAGGDFLYLLMPVRL
jgi:arylsulfatase A-like enzyme